MRDELMPSLPIDIDTLFAQPLPQADPARLEGYNRIVRATHFAGVTIRNRTVSFRLIPLPHDMPAPSHGISVVLGEKRLTIGCCLNSFEVLFGDTIDTSASDLNMLRVLLHLLASDCTGPVAKLAGDRAALDISCNAPAPAPLAMGLEMHVAGQDVTPVLRVSGDLDLLLPLCKTAPTVAPPKLSRQLILTCWAVSIPFVAASADMTTVACDDLIFLERIPEGGLFTLRVEDTDIAQVTLARGKLVVTQRLPAQNAPLEKGPQTMASDQTKDTSPEITTQLSLEIGRWTMSLDEIDTIAAGSVLEVGKIDTNAVKVRLNGEIVATGALINLGESIGIQIRTLT